MCKVIFGSILLILSATSSVLSAVVSDTQGRLFKVIANADTSSILECVHMEDIDSCIKININFDAMMQSDDMIMVEDDLVFERKYSTQDEVGQSQSFSYEGANFSYAILTYTEAPVS